MVNFIFACILPQLKENKIDDSIPFPSIPYDLL